MKLLICGDYVPYNRTISLNDNGDIDSIFNDFCHMSKVKNITNNNKRIEITSI